MSALQLDAVTHRQLTALRQILTRPLNSRVVASEGSFLTLPRVYPDVSAACIVATLRPPETVITRYGEHNEDCANSCICVGGHRHDLGFLSPRGESGSEGSLGICR